MLDFINNHFGALCIFLLVAVWFIGNSIADIVGRVVAGRVQVAQARAREAEAGAAVAKDGAA